MNGLMPSGVMRAVAAALPDACHGNVVIIGSLAAGYHFFRNSPATQVRTKDVDCVLSPSIKAVPVGKRIAEELLAAGWSPRFMEHTPRPGSSETPDDELPAIRLNPPDTKTWFLELLTTPENQDQGRRTWNRVELPIGDFGIPAFRFMSVAVWRPLESAFGIRYAQPALMALANLLEHPEIGPQVMGEPMEGRKIKRTNKDLGRVLAIARLSEDAELMLWPRTWQDALEHHFPAQAGELAARTGSGLRALLSSPDDLQQAAWSCNVGLLAAQPGTAEQLRFTGRRLLADIIDPFEARVRTK